MYGRAGRCTENRGHHYEEKPSGCPFILRITDMAAESGAAFMAAAGKGRRTGGL